MRIERANAKINLYLDVTGRRENGYHDIVSIMQTVSVCDLISLDYRPSPHTAISLRASGNADMPTDCRNLAWRAAELYLKETQRTGEVSITIEKHIPMAAGLAGGSSDAAAVLRGLNRLCGSPLSTEELMRLGARLGADIPFCVMGGSALVTGIGDCLEPIDPMPPQTLVVACQGEGISTPWGYGKLDELHGFFADRSFDDSVARGIARAMKSKESFDTCHDFYNIFEEIVPTVQPYVDQIKNAMKEAGARFAMMSGSGPSVFGLFDDPDQAMAACERLKKDGAAAFVCHPTAKYPV